MPGTGGSAPLYSTLRTLWGQLAPNEPVPDSLRVYGLRAVRPYRLTVPADFQQALAALAPPAGSVDEQVWALLAAILRLRSIELLPRLRLGDIWLSGDRVVGLVWGKGDKRRTVFGLVPAGVCAWLQGYLAARRRISGGDPAAPVFDPDVLPGGRATDARLRRALADACPGLTPHDLRRLGANRARAAGEPLLEVIGALGHSSLTTAPRSYLTVLPLLQAECLAEHYRAQWPEAFTAGSGPTAWPAPRASVARRCASSACAGVWRTGC